MNEVEYERSEEMRAIGAAAKANLDAIVAQLTLGGTVASLARSAYKYTDCGAAVGALVQVAGGDEPDKWLYGSELNDIKPDTAVLALCVSSIVEGVEQCTETHIVDLLSDEFETPEDAVHAYEAALDAVEAEAREIWNQTHGCETCRKHWVAEGFGDGTIDGMPAVWDECPECKGAGTII